MSSDDDRYIDVREEALEAIIDALLNSTKQFLMAELRRIIEANEIKPHAREVMPYLYAGAFLSLSGREINAENISNLFKIVGMTADVNVLTLLAKAKLRSHLVYVYAYYYILSMGKISSQTDMLNVVTALGMDPDKSRIQDIIDFLSAPVEENKQTPK